MLNEILDSTASRVPKYSWLDRSDFDPVIKQLSSWPWEKSIVKRLKTKLAALKSAGEENARSDAP